MYCLSCGLIDLRPKARFCDKCGKHLLQMNIIQLGIVRAIASNRTVLTSSFAQTVFRQLGLTVNCAPEETTGFEN